MTEYKKVKTTTRNGSWFWCIFWMIFCFPIGVLYWLFKMRKTKSEQYIPK